MIDESVLMCVVVPVVGVCVCVCLHHTCSMLINLQSLLKTCKKLRSAKLETKT